MNEGLSKAIPEILSLNPDLIVYHQIGKGNTNYYDSDYNGRLYVKEYFDKMYDISGAADLVITRGGANTLGELAMQGKATIIVPNPKLTGGHQIKNAEYLSSVQAALVLTEDELLNTKTVVAIINKTLNDRDLLMKLQQNISNNIKHDAVESVVDLIYKINDKSI